MKNFKIKIVTIFVLSILAVNNIYSQWNWGTPPFLVTNPATQRVGIGVATPTQFLQVTGGNIDLNTTTKSYMINGQPFLWNNNIPTATIVGWNSGMVNWGLYNTFVGGNVGTVNTSGSQNMFIGYESGYNNTTGGNNSFSGFQAGLYSTSGSDNTFSGYRAGFGSAGITTASKNTFTGSQAGMINTTGGNNTFTGYQSGTANTTGSLNTFYGFASGASNTTSNYNTFLGYNAGLANTTGPQNTFVGSQCGLSNTTATENTFMGESTGMNTTTGFKNTFLGEESGWHNNIGNNNVYVGHLAGYYCTGSNNVFIGDYADAIIGAPALTNATAIGRSAKATTSNTVIIGTDSVKVGIGLSRDLAGPQTLLGPLNPGLEINADRSNFTYTGVGSGLRFRQLTTANTPLPVNPGSGVLAVNASGDVVYVPDNGGGTINNANNGLSIDPAFPNTVQFGNNIAATTAQLLNDREVPMHNHNIIFTDPALPTSGFNRIGLGIASPAAKLDLYNTDNIPGVNITTNLSTSSASSTGLQVSASGASYGNWGINAKTVSGIGGSFQNIALQGNASNASGQNLGVMGLANSTVGINYGVQGVAINSTVKNWGIYGQAPTPAISPSDYAGYFDGNVNVNGSCFNTTGGVWLVSDQIFKTNVDSISNALNLIKQFKPKTYYMDTTNRYGMNFSSKHQLGFLAQDVEQILPELVNQTQKLADIDSTGNVIHPAITYKALNYIEFIPLLLKGIQEQSRTIDSLKTKTTKQDSINRSLQNQLNNLSNIINQCCSSHIPPQNNITAPIGKSDVSNTDVTLTDVQAVVLSQNVPNPYS